MALKPTNFPNGISGPIVGSTGAQESAITDLTDSTGGTATDTLAAITAGAAYAQADATAMKNAIASLGAKLNAVIAALEAAGVIAE